MKVHFAGYAAHRQALDRAGIRYVLESFYEMRTMASVRLAEVIRSMNSKPHAIIDSGLFTLMFGAKSSTELTEQLIEQWQDEYANIITSSGFIHSVVECDVQKKLSPEFAWEMRKKFKTQVKNEIINVYHLEDGNPDKLIDHSSYIAVSIPELRIAVSRKERDRITEYIATRAIRKGKKVHLLGCTEKWMLKKYSFCTTCDSTSWMSSTKYGGVTKFPSVGKEIPIGSIKRNRIKDFNQGASDDYWQSVFWLRAYESIVGDQS